MAAEETKSAGKTKKESVTQVTFKCRLCEKEKPITEMKLITRYRPVVVVCNECEKGLR